MQARQFCILTIIVMINRDCGMLPQVCLPFGLAGSQRHLGGKILYCRSLKNLSLEILEKSHLLILEHWLSLPRSTALSPSQLRRKLEISMCFIKLT